MRSSSREATAANSKQLKEKIKQRELTSAQRKSRKLIKLADKNKASLDEAIELSRVVETSESSDSNCEDSTGDPPLIDNTVECATAGQEEDCYWYDTSNLELISPIHSPVTPTAASEQDSATWSSVNQFFPEGCIVSPTFLPEPLIMDAKTLKAKVKGLENLAVGIDLLIERYNPDIVTVLDKDD